MSTTLALKKHTDSMNPQPSDRGGKKKKGREWMTALIYIVIKSPANGVSISSATAAVKNKPDLREGHLRVGKQRKGRNTLGLWSEIPPARTSPLSSTSGCWCHLVLRELIAHIFNALITPQQLCTVI